MDHHNGNVSVAIRWDLVLHIHLVNRYLTAACADTRSGCWAECFRFSPNEKAALTGYHEWFFEIVPLFCALIFVLSERWYADADG